MLLKTVDWYWFLIWPSTSKIVGWSFLTVAAIDEIANAAALLEVTVVAFWRLAARSLDSEIYCNKKNTIEYYHTSIVFLGLQNSI
jgi:hypothetical protein